MSAFGEVRSEWGLRKIVLAVASGFGVIALIVFGSMLLENNGASEIMVVQSPLSGEFTVYKTPGLKMQGGGTITRYKLRDQFWFSSDPSRGSGEDQSIEIRFNDNGRARLSGSISWEMPLSDSAIIQLHRQYGSAEAIQHQLISTVVGKSVFLTGPLMSSTESNSTKRNDLLSLIIDQINHGVYKTESRETRVQDEMTGVTKTVRITTLVPSTVAADRGYARQEGSPLDEFNIRTFNLAIDQIHYDSTVEMQIKQQQTAIMQVQTALAQAKTAEQAAITAEKNGQAEAAKARWEQEVIKAREVTSAEQRREVARLDAEAADFRKLANIRDGEGEARKRQLIMNADGALSMKLEAFVKVNQFYATAIQGYTGNWVPSIVMGSSGASSAPGSGANGLIDMLMARTARDLALDFRAGLGNDPARPRAATPAPRSTP
ncbi:MAG: hypothetical protein AB200_00560 [Parcubacteria bacterium C7867-005]|nr:MAG: hypothetical protein AB200_00560 [Parcubacteria bacterium C7867-005]